MKFDTKKTSSATPCKKSPEHCFIQENPFIPVQPPPRDEDGEEETKEHEEEEGEGELGGRMVLYKPTVVFSKVYGSKRLYEKPGANKKKRAITEDGVNGLIQNLESLFINTTIKEGGEESATEEEEEKEKETEKKKKNKVLGSFEIQESSFSASVVPDQTKSSTKMATKVRRSRRLAKWREEKKNCRKNIDTHRQEMRCAFFIELHSIPTKKYSTNTTTL